MAISTKVANNYLLNTWQDVMIENIWHFNQVDGKGAPLNDGCQVYLQFERDPIARALNQATQRFADILQFWPRPKWFEDILFIGHGVPYWRQVRQTQKSLKLIEFGQRATTLITANAAIVYSDPNNIGIDTLATMTTAAPVGVTNAEEIAVFFRVADGALGAGDERFQIEPLEVDITAGVITITGHRALFVKPSTIWFEPWLLTNPNYTERNAADTQTPGDFVTQIDIYRVYNDDTTQVQVLSHNNTVLQTVDAVIVDPELGLFELPYECWPSLMACGYPVRLKIYYRAGQALEYGMMDSEIQEGIIRLANTLMPEKFCSLCDRTHDRWSQDRRPMVDPVGGGGSFVSTLGTSIAGNPFGVLQGQIHAWRIVSDRYLPRAGKLTSTWR